MFVETPGKMDKFAKIMNAGNSGAAAFFRNKTSQKNGQKLRALGIELPPLYPWAPDLPKHPAATHRSNSAQSSVKVNFNGVSTGSSIGPELPAESHFIPASPTGPGSNTETILPDKYFTNSPRGDERSKRSTATNPHVSSSSPSLSSSPHPYPTNYSSPTGTSPHAYPTNYSSPTATSPHSYPTNYTSPTTSTHGYGLQHKRNSPNNVNTRKRATINIGVQTISTDCGHRAASILSLCKEMLSVTLLRMKKEEEARSGEEEGLVDRILCSCESIKVAVINILEAYTQAQESGQSSTTFAESELVRVTSIQLVTSLELLVSQASLWVATYAGVDSDMIQRINKGITDTVKDLACELLSFIQGCENDIDSQAHESSAKILSLLYELVQHCGELSLATDVAPVLLRDDDKETLEELMSLGSSREDDLVHIRPSSDLKQAFLNGVDAFVDSALEGSMSTMEDHERHAQSLSPGGRITQEACGGNTEVLKHVYIAVATSKLLLYKCREIQVELDTEMQEDILRGDNYYHRYYCRCQAILNHVNTLTDSLSLLVQAAEPMVLEPNPGTLKKICRCSEMVQRASKRLVDASCTESDPRDWDKGSIDSNSTIRSSMISPVNSLSLDLSFLRSENPNSSILTSDQIDQLTDSWEDVKLSTKTLIHLARNELAVKWAGQDVKVKRMLPATPTNVRPTARCKSARSVEMHKLSQNLAKLTARSFNET